MQTVDVKSIERYDGNLANADEFLMRFEGDAHAMGYLDVYKGTSTAPNTQAAIDTMPATNAAETRARNAAQAELTD